MRLTKRLTWRALSSSLYARMALILLAGLLVAQGVSVWLQWGERAAVVSQVRGLNMLDRIAEAVRNLESTEPARREEALLTLQYGGLQVELITPDVVFPNAPNSSFQTMLIERLGSNRDIRSTSGGPGMGMGPGAGKGIGALGQRSNIKRSVDIRLIDGQWVRITTGQMADATTPALSNMLIIQLLFSLGLVGAAVLIAVRQATRPLQQLAQAADTLGRDLNAPPLAEDGSAETRRAAQAFNRMQTKIKRLVSERASALAAVSHDLRTPLTRLRLRTELIDDEGLREQMAADLEAMAAMIDATLDYLRGLQTNEVVRAIDINALLESMAEDAKVLGRNIQILGQTLKPFNGRLSALRRALQNLIDNAFKYGHGANIRVEDSVSHLNITVEDEGPGIAPEDLAKVTDPYFRVDGARTQPKDGVGLGLSIVKDIALMHNGELLLANRPQGGLAATMVLPRS
ncbi:ATP-binding protein [Rhodoferax sp.]|uniref:ATP-binding protein n=2 Tax=Rhodoferax sp. TaxID=50421 RepID=UPI00273358E5|nr:ATP-binding protein [Rhodoferax sp.]MDP3192443.1 ATP-binding protein [Rhodoferax sp.]